MSTQLKGLQGNITLSFPLTKIGRTQENQLVINDKEVSGHHAEIIQQGYNYVLVDLGSTNGTFVNGQKLVPHVPRPLGDGDTIRFGNTVFSYENKSFQHIPTRVTSPSSTPPSVLPPLSNSSPRRLQQQASLSKPPKDSTVKVAWIGLVSAILAALIGGVFGVIKLAEPTSSVPRLHASYTGTLTSNAHSGPTSFTISSLTEDDNGTFNASGSEGVCSTTYQGTIHTDNSISFTQTEVVSSNCPGGIATLIGKLFPDQHLEGTWKGQGSYAPFYGLWSMQ